jgi:uncharacterized protein YkwD
MAFGAKTRSLTRLTALTVAATLAVTAGSAAESASAATPCAKYGDVSAKRLKNREARAAIKCLINKERRNRGIGGLDRDRRLQKAAQKHNEVMMQKNCFSHQCPGEPSLQARLGIVDYIIGGLLRWTYGENIAYGGSYYGTPKAIMKAWMKSSGHKANILNPAFDDLGVGFSQGTPGHPGTNGGLYTTDFGLRIG